MWGHNLDEESGEFVVFENDSLRLGAVHASAGDLSLTIEGFARFAYLQIDAGEVLTDGALRDVQRTAPGSNSGAGVGVGSLDGHRYFGHVGSTGIYWARFMAFPDERVAIVVATNAPVDAIEQRAILEAFKRALELSRE